MPPHKWDNVTCTTWWIAIGSGKAGIGAPAPGAFLSPCPGPRPPDRDCALNVAVGNRPARGGRNPATICRGPMVWARRVRRHGCYAHRDIVRFESSLRRYPLSVLRRRVHLLSIYMPGADGRTGEGQPVKMSGAQGTQRGKHSFAGRDRRPGRSPIYLRVGAKE